MTRITPLEIDDLDEASKKQIDFAARLMGFTPNDALVMARNPALLQAMGALVAAIYGPGKIDAGLKRLIGEAASKAAGCIYCSAHAAKGALDQGVSAEKIEAVWSYQDSPLFSDAERAAIQVAMRASMSPNETTDEDFENLKQHFDQNEIVEIVSVIAMFGFLNRWNSTLKTQIEPAPLAVLDAIKLEMPL